MKDKHYKPFFLTDADGKLFKAVPLKDEDIPMEEEEEQKQVLKEAGAKPGDEEPAGNKPEAVLTADDIAALKEMIAAHKAAQEQPQHEGEDVHDEEEDVEKDEEIDEEKVIDTAAHDSVKSGFGSLQKKKEQKVQDSATFVDVEDAWKKRYNK